LFLGEVAGLIGGKFVQPGLVFLREDSSSFLSEQFCFLLLEFFFGFVAASFNSDGGGVHKFGVDAQVGFAIFFSNAGGVDGRIFEFAGVGSVEGEILKLAVLGRLDVAEGEAAKRFENTIDVVFFLLFVSRDFRKAGDAGAVLLQSVGVIGTLDADAKDVVLVDLGELFVDVVGGGGLQVGHVEGEVHLVAVDEPDIGAAGLSISLANDKTGNELVGVFRVFAVGTFEETNDVASFCFRDAQVFMVGGVFRNQTAGNLDFKTFAEELVDLVGLGGVVVAIAGNETLALTREGGGIVGLAELDLGDGVGVEPLNKVTGSTSLRRTPLACRARWASSSNCPRSWSIMGSSPLRRISSRRCLAACCTRPRRIIASASLAWMPG